MFGVIEQGLGCLWGDINRGILHSWVMLYENTSCTFFCLNQCIIHERVKTNGIRLLYYSYGLDLRLGFKLMTTHKLREACVISPKPPMVLALLFYKSLFL